jgi:hypothetical protein
VTAHVISYNLFSEIHLKYDSISFKVRFLRYIYTCIINSNSSPCDSTVIPEYTRRYVLTLDNNTLKYKI